MTEYNYSIHATWRVEPTPPTVLGEKFLRALDLIAESVPEVGAWMIQKRPFRDGYLSVEEARKVMPELVEDNVKTVDNGDEPDPDYGYCLIATNKRGFSSKSIGLTASVGGKFGDRIRFRVGFVDVPSDLETVTYPLFRAALLTIIGQWPSIWANAYVSGSGRTETETGIPPHPASRYNIPWLSYLSAPLVVDFEPPFEVFSERTPDGGLLMIAAEERLDPANPEHMRRSRAITEIMIARAGDPGRNGPPVGKFIWPTRLQ